MTHFGYWQLKEVQGSPIKRKQKYCYQTALTSDRLCLKTNIGHHRSQRYLAGYCPAKNVIQCTFIFNSPGTYHALFISNPKNLRQPSITDQALTPYSLLNLMGDWCGST